MGGRRSCSLLLLLLAYLAVPLMLFTGNTQAAESLKIGGSIKDGETLVSNGEVFELGFFSAGGSSSRYLGVWYKNIPVQTVVWVANRDRSLTDTSGVLTLDDSGNLILLNGRGSPFVLASSPGSEAPVALLLDDGNFVLAGAGNRSRVFWQSFDHPTDTFLPGMRLGLEGQQNRLLTSWRSPDDPAPGDFEFGVDPNHTAQYFMWQRGYKYWSSGLWNGKTFSSAPEMTALVMYGFVSNSEETYFTYSVRDTSVLPRVVMDYSGRIKQLMWVEDAKYWVLVWSHPIRYPCEYPYACGNNGVCVNNSAAPCSCLRGFSPDSSLKWDYGNWSGGCERTTPLLCGDGDGFMTLQKIKLPVTFLNSRTIDNLSLGIGGCGELCAKDCSCTAYASAYKNATGCLLWLGDLVGLQQDGNTLQDLYVRVAASALRDESGNSNEKKKLLLQITIPGVSVGMVLAFCVIKRWLKRRNSVHKGEEETNQELIMLEIGDDGSKGCGQFSLLGFDKIVAATDNFSAENKLGEGGFGPVYKGLLSEGQEIAVKRLSRQSGQGMDEFKTEILLIAKLQHRNLVRLLGCCIKGEEKMLIYEYMSNKSLDSFLFDPTRASLLDWAKRVQIIEGIAQGLLYLHKHSRLRVIHRDLKASNILLDGELNPKISDFGMARIFSSNDSATNTNRVVGTYGYMSPEYAMEGTFSVKSDIFSFGVLLLETMSGKRNTSAHHFTGSLNLLGHAWKLWNEGRELELLDPSLGDSCPTPEVSRYMHVALMCVQEAATDRPTTSDVVAMLGAENASLPPPKQPAFLFGRNTAAEVSHPELPASRSINLMTISVPDGR